MLKLSNLSVTTEGKEILKGVDLRIPEHEVHVLMGPNGSGKSTLAKVIMGHPAYQVVSGKLEFDDQSLLALTPDQRAHLGLFAAFQYPTEVPGVNFRQFLRLAYNSSRPKEAQLPVFKFREMLIKQAELLEIEPALLERNLNEGLSGGEKKKMEVLQLAILDPKLAILDETDSGLDIDSLKSIFGGIAKLKAQRPAMTLLVITHYHKIFDYLTPDKIHVLKAGKIIKSGGSELLAEIETTGFKSYAE